MVLGLKSMVGLKAKQNKTKSKRDGDPVVGQEGADGGGGGPGAVREGRGMSVIRMRYTDVVHTRMEL